MIKMTSRGSFKNTINFLKKTSSADIQKILEYYGEKGVAALKANTPVKTGKTASSWSYRLKKEKHGYSIFWENSNYNNNVSIALIIQTGHGTRNGGYVKGVDYINPAIKPIFDEMADQAWKEVIST